MNEPHLKVALILATGLPLLFQNDFFFNQQAKVKNFLLLILQTPWFSADRNGEGD